MIRRCVCNKDISFGQNKNSLGQKLPPATYGKPPDKSDKNQNIFSKKVINLLLKVAKASRQNSYAGKLGKSSQVLGPPPWTWENQNLGKIWEKKLAGRWFFFILRRNWIWEKIILHPPPTCWEDFPSFPAYEFWRLALLQDWNFGK